LLIYLHSIDAGWVSPLSDDLPFILFDEKKHLQILKNYIFIGLKNKHYLAKGKEFGQNIILLFDKAYSKKIELEIESKIGIIQISLIHFKNEIDAKYFERLIEFVSLTNFFDQFCEMKNDYLDFESYILIWNIITNQIFQGKNKIVL